MAHSDSITIVIPLPPRELSPNYGRQGCVQAVARKRKVYRATVKLLARMKMNGCQLSAVSSQLGRPGPEKTDGRMPAFPWSRVECRAVFYWATRRRRDLRNAEHSLKAAYDGLVDAGLIADDSVEVLTHGPTRFELDPGRPRVELEVRWINGECRNQNV